MNTQKKMTVKCKDKMCFSLGFVAIKKDDGTIEGRRCRMIDYTGRVVVSAKEENQQIKKEVNRVKRVTSKRAPWYQ